MTIFLTNLMMLLNEQFPESAPQIARCVQSGDVLAIDNVTSDAPLCALAFKTIHHPQRGAITFLRLYSGTIGAKTVRFIFRSWNMTEYFTKFNAINDDQGTPQHNAK